MRRCKVWSGRPWRGSERGGARRSEKGAGTPHQASFGASAGAVWAVRSAAALARFSVRSPMPNPICDEARHAVSGVCAVEEALCPFLSRPLTEDVRRPDPGQSRQERRFPSTCDRSVGQ